MDLGLLESVPDAMIVADESGTILYVNGVTERLFGWARGDLVGRPVEVMLPARFRAVHEVHRGGYHAAPRTRSMGLGLDLSGLRRDGTEFAAEISLASMDVDGRRCVAAAVRDVTDRKKLEDRAQRLRRAQQGKPIQLVARPDGSRALLVVTDGGIGLAHDAQRRVFERFARAVPSRNFGGLGLGLYIARQIVEAHGGHIEVASEPGAGATFTVELPLEGEGTAEPTARA
jgi:PAS domain S-box-containing protein